MVCECMPAAVVSFLTAWKIYQSPLFAWVVAKTTCARWAFCSSITSDKNTQNPFLTTSPAGRTSIGQSHVHQQQDAWVAFCQMHILLWNACRFIRATYKLQKDRMHLGATRNAKAVGPSSYCALGCSRERLPLWEHFQKMSRMHW